MIVHSREGAPAVVPNSLVKLDPGTGEVLDVIRVGRQPVAAAVVGDSVWVSNNEDATVTRVDVKTGHTETFGELRPSLDLVADGKGHVWVSLYFYEQVTRIDTQTLHKDIVPLGRKAFLLGIGAGSLWVTETPANLGDRGTVARKCGTKSCAWRPPLAKRRCRASQDRSRDRRRPYGCVRTGTPSGDLW